MLLVFYTLPCQQFFLLFLLIFCQILFIVIKRLPKTRSGKILRGTIRKIADGDEYKIPATIDDPEILSEIKEDLIKNNILKN